MRSTLFTPIAVLVLALAATAQCSLVKDINTTDLPLQGHPGSSRAGEGGTNVQAMVQVVPNTYYFTAYGAGTGRELWKTDGTAAGTAMVKDILPGIDHSHPNNLCACNGKVFFRASIPSRGAELWVSDGTAAGTVMVKDINPGSTSSDVSYVTCLNNKVCFAANDGIGGNELWVSDGTAAGTVMLKDIYPGSGSSSPRYLRSNSAGTRLLFAADDGTAGYELWATDGTAAGTYMVKDIYTGPNSSSPAELVNLGSLTLFRASDSTNGNELWKTDGTAAGTSIVKDIRAGSLGSAPYLRDSDGAVLGGSLFFFANDGQYGSELWKSDGTAAGTVLVKDIRTGPNSSFPRAFAVAGSTLFFQAYTNYEREELWKSDGTAAGTVLVKDILVGTGGSRPINITPLASGVVLFAASNGSTAGGSGVELWRSDGTAAGTILVKDIHPGPDKSSSPSGFTPLGVSGRVLFAATDDSPSGNGRELYETDGTPAGTRVFKDCYPGKQTGPSIPAFLTSAGGKRLFYEADNGINGDELWMTDATGTRMVKDINPGSGDSDPDGFTSMWTGSQLITLFSANDGANGQELWRTDGTAAGTVMVKDINPGSGSSFFPSRKSFTVVGNECYFSANNGTLGEELWKTDGTAAGTVLVKDLASGSRSGIPTRMVAYNGGLIFFAVGTWELWKSDGTSAGTVKINDLKVLSGLTHFKGKLLFGAADRANHGDGELWITDGTVAGTVMVKDIHPGANGSNPDSFAVLGSECLFVADDGTNGYELWKTDGTANGTVMVKDIYPGSGSSRILGPPTLYRAVSQGLLYFAATTPGAGTELWKTDGSAAGTVMVKDIHPGSSSSNPAFLMAAGAGVYFRAQDPSVGHELFFSDGTVAGTNIVCDLKPGVDGSYPSFLAVSDGSLYFSATHPAYSNELFKLDTTPGTVEHLGGNCGTDLRLASTQPVAGRNLVLSCSGATGGIRLLVAGLPGAPITIPLLVSPTCAIWPDLTVPVILPMGSTMTIPLPSTIPTGVKLSFQVAQAPLPLSLSNGLLLTSGK